MLKLFNRKKKDNKGFTLVELVIVVAILAILVGILAPQYTKYVEKSRKAADAANLENLVTAFKTGASDGSNDIPKGKYTIAITKTETTLTVDGVDTSTEAGKAAVKKVTDLITSYAGDKWELTKLKSSRWTDDGTLDGKVVEEIKAELTVANDGSISVKYIPETIKNQTNQ